MSLQRSWNLKSEIATHTAEALKLCFLFGQEPETGFLTITKNVPVSKNLRQRLKLGFLKTPFSNFYAYKIDNSICRKKITRNRSL